MKPTTSNKYTLIKVALGVSINGIIFPTNFAMPKIRFIPNRVKLFQLQINSDIHS